MSFESFNYNVGQHDHAPCFGSLGFGFDVSSISCKKVERSTNPEKAVLKINVRPFESKQLTTSHTCCQSNYEEDLQTTSTYCCQEFVCLLHCQRLYLILFD